MIRAPFFNGDVYRDVARNWSGIGFWYLLVLLAIAWVVVLVKLHRATGVFVRDDFPQMVQDVPPVTIKNGHVSTPASQPYFIREHNSGKAVVAIDTTGKVNSMDDTDALVLLTDHKLWYRQNNNNEIKQQDLSKVKYFYVDKAKITG